MCHAILFDLLDVTDPSMMTASLPVSSVLVVFYKERHVMKKVLLPMDGSPCALRGAALVVSKRAHYANPQDLEIHLVNVQAAFPHDVGRFSSHEQMAAFHREESEKAMREARELLDAAGATYVCHHEVGKVAETISHLADALGCDQIVMGTHGRGALNEFLRGSITLKVVHLAKVPVLLVK